MTDIVTPQPISPLSAAPLPTDAPDVFDAKAFARLQSEDLMVQQTNAIAQATHQNATAAFERVTMADASAQAAAASSAAAAASASAAAASANTAAASAGGQLWVSGTTYAVGALVFSAVTGRNYRRVVAGAGTTDPSADNTNWRAVLLDAATLLPTLRPSLLLDFSNSRSVDPRITFVRASTATRTNDRGLIETVAANVPRIDFDPVTLACRGLLIEESRTNYITNNTMQGVVVGSPGTTPTGWSGAGTGSGVTRTVVATGEEDGISYVDVRFEGTPTVNNVTFVFTAANAIAAASGQAWALSAYLKLVGGSFANTSPALDILETDGTNGIGSNLVTCVATSAPLVTQRFVYAATLRNAGTTHVQPRLRVGLTTDQPIDFTLRIGLPQLEAGGSATSVIRTTGAAATRAADVPVMTGANFSSWYRQDEGTFVLEGDTNNSGYGTFLSANDGTSGNEIRLIAWNDGVLRIATSSGGVAVTNSNTPAIPSAPPRDGSRFVAAMTYKTAELAAAHNGAVVVSGGALASYVPPAVNRMHIGSTRSSFYMNGHIRRIAYYPVKLSSSQLQALTS